MREIEVKVNPILAAGANRKHDKIPDIIQKPISNVAAQHLLATAANAPDKVKACLERLAKLAQKNPR